MPPLKSLQRDFPIIDADFVRFCASHAILSVEDFIFHDLYMLVAFAENEATPEKLKKGITQVLSIIDRQHQPWKNGLRLLEDAQQNELYLSTGCEGIDFLLQGGLRTGQLTELAGPSSSGKTQVCLLAASNIAVKYPGSVMFFDTCNSFSSKRIAQLVNWLLRAPDKEDKETTLETVMSRILHHSVFDIFTLLGMLQKQLDFTSKTQVKGKESRMLLLIIDSISSLITPILGGKDSNGRCLMVSAGYILKKLASEHNISVLVTNHTVGGEGGIPKPALGESWKTIPHVRLLLSPEPGSILRNISILKHPSMACGRWVRFAIHQ